MFDLLGAEAETAAAVRDRDRERRDRERRDRERRDRDDRRRPRRPSPRPSSSQPPAEHYRHRDYVFVANHGWWPRWFPYWEPYWYEYWKYLYLYYGGDRNSAYAQQMRDATLRTYAPQRGWL